MGVNKQIRDFQENLLKQINQEQLPLEVKRLVLAELMKALQDACDNEVRKEEEEENEQSIQQNKLAE